MPNWCYNDLIVKGTPDKVQRFMQENRGYPADYSKKVNEDKSAEPRFCFNALVPTPQSVVELGYDAHNKIQKIAAEQGEGAVAGMIDGYHWNRENWGTKWDIYGERSEFTETVVQEDADTKTLRLSFDTANSPPVPWLVAVAAKFPTLCLALRFAEPNINLAGDVVCTGNDVQIDHHPYWTEDLEESEASV